MKQPSQDVYAVVNKDKGDSATAKQTVRKHLCITYMYMATAAMQNCNLLLMVIHKYTVCI